MWIDDEIIKDCRKPYMLKSFIPQKNMVVLGRSNKESECYKEQCQRDGVEILRRYGGGGTVLLHDGCVVVSFGCWVKEAFHNGRYFDLLNSAVIKSLSNRWPKLEDLSQNGISDIVWNDKKIAGTSLFRSRKYLLYQASILVDRKIELIEKYLAHPSLEPDYREGKPHKDFVVSLNIIDNNILEKAVLEHFERDLLNEIKLHLKNELCDPMEGHIKYLLKKVTV